MIDFIVMMIGLLGATSTFALFRYHVAGEDINFIVGSSAAIGFIIGSCLTAWLCIIVKL